MTDVVIREGDRVVWEKGHYVSGDPGLAVATPQARPLELAQPGDYSLPGFNASVWSV
jgi:hypothetical protein